jgi:hypothetical protein
MVRVPIITKVYALNEDYSVTRNTFRGMREIQIVSRLPIALHCIARKAKH